MKNHLVKLCCTALFTLSFNADAILLKSSDTSFGVGTLTEVKNGLSWLDLSVTQNQSYNDVLGQMGSGGLFEDYRYASTEEVAGLFDAAVSQSGTTTGPVTPYAGEEFVDQLPFFSNPGSSVIKTLLDLWGDLNSYQSFALTSTQTTDSSSQILARAWHNGIPFYSPDVLGRGSLNLTNNFHLDPALSTYTIQSTAIANFQTFNFGSALVLKTAVPAPTALWLIITGFGLFGLRRFNQLR